MDTTSRSTPIRQRPLNASRMNTSQTLPLAVHTTMRAFETLIELEETRRRQVLKEISELTLQLREEGVVRDLHSDDGQLQPRLLELHSLERRIALVRTKLEEMRAQWPHPRLPYITKIADRNAREILCLEA